MPRRKQARPRRRSGEGGPHDYSSKSASPLTIGPDVNPNETEINDERIENNRSNTSSSHHSHSHSDISNVNEQRKLVNKRIESLANNANLDTDKVVDCTVAAIEQSIIRDKLNANEDDMTDNELDDDDDEG